MTTPAQLSAQLVELMTRWNAQQDQLANWLTGSPAGGPNADGRYPLTNAEGTTELFLSLPAVLSQVSGPAADAADAQAAAETAQALAQAAKAAAETARAAAQTARSDTQALKSIVDTQQADVAAKWSDVRFWYENSEANAAAVEEGLVLVEAIYNELAGLCNPSARGITFDQTDLLFSSDDVSMDATSSRQSCCCPCGPPSATETTMDGGTRISSTTVTMDAA